MPSEGRLNFIEELADSYRRANYDIIATTQEYPGIFKENDSVQGKVDLLLEDSCIPDSYKIVEPVYTESVDPKTIKNHIDRKQTQAQKNKKYFESVVDNGEFVAEVVLGTEGDLNAIRELWENTTGVFTWDQAVNAVSEKGRLGNMRDDGYIVLNHEVSREENEEYFNLSPGLEEITNLLWENKTYP